LEETEKSKGKAEGKQKQSIAVAYSNFASKEAKTINAPKAR
jgi:hypothetical protein